MLYKILRWYWIVTMVANGAKPNTTYFGNGSNVYRPETVAHMVKKTQSIEAKNPTFLAFLHPDGFLPYMVCSALHYTGWPVLH